MNICLIQNCASSSAFAAQYLKYICTALYFALHLIQRHAWNLNVKNCYNKKVTWHGLRNLGFVIFSFANSFLSPRPPSWSQPKISFLKNLKISYSVFIIIHIFIWLQSLNLKLFNSVNQSWRQYELIIRNKYNVQTSLYVWVCQKYSAEWEKKYIGANKGH